MWHNVGLTLLVFVATLLIVLLLMVCGEWGRLPRGQFHTPGCGLACFVWFFVCFLSVDGQMSYNQLCPLTSQE